MIAPGTEVSPPRITTSSAFSATSEARLHAKLLPQITPAPAWPATLQTMTQMRLSGMPTDCAAW